VEELTEDGMESGYGFDGSSIRGEDVPNLVELRWRPGDHQAAVTASV
jgi:hypothetical protein